MLHPFPSTAATLPRECFNLCSQARAKDAIPAAAQTEPRATADSFSAVSSAVVQIAQCRSIVERHIESLVIICNYLHVLNPHALVQQTFKQCSSQTRPVALDLSEMTLNRIRLPAYVAAALELREHNGFHASTPFETHVRSGLGRSFSTYQARILKIWDRLMVEIGSNVLQHGLGVLAQREA